MLTWELLGAVVGAGLASGREIASFFACYGPWSFLGIVLAITLMCALSAAKMPSSWQGRWPEKAWRAMLDALLLATGGAMLAGAGTVASLMLPVHGAGAAGMGVTLLLANVLARHTRTGLSCVSRIMLILLGTMIFCGIFLPPMKAATVAPADPAHALMKGAAYGGFNASLQASILMRTKDNAVQKRAVRRAGIILAVVPMMGNVVLLRHSALRDVPMPFVRMLARFGRIGYALGGLAMYLAILSTLTACLRGLRSGWGTAGIAAISLCGFSGVVERVYPVLGLCCCAMLCALKFVNRNRGTFNSRANML